MSVRPKPKAAAPAPSTPKWMEDLKTIGLTDEQIEMLVKEGATSAEDLTLLTAEQIKLISGCGLIMAMKIVSAFAPKEEPKQKMQEGAKPQEDETPAKVAQTMGVPADTLNMFLLGNLAGSDMDLSDVFPIAQIVASYDPKKRGIWNNMMTRIAERHKGVPIVVINYDGSVNTDATAEYITELESGFPATGSTYEHRGAVYEVIAVGVDSTAVFDEDPLAPGQALRKGKGVGRVNWARVPLDVRQAVRIAVETREINVGDEATLRMLRNLIDDETTLTTLQDEMPKAVAEFYRRNRTGNLPQLKTTVGKAQETAAAEGATPTSGVPFRVRQV